MQQSPAARTPVHVWIVGGLATLWNAFGAYDYLMTRLRNTDYIASAMPGVDPQTALAWVDAMPVYAQIGWGLGVWTGLAGSLLLLARSRYAYWAFGASLVGAALSLGWQLVAAPPLPGAESAVYKIVPVLIIAICIFLFAYSGAMKTRGLLR